MPRFHFDICSPDEERFRDDVGSEIDDLAAAHSRAVELARRVMSIGGFAECSSGSQRWTVRIINDRQQPVLTVIFPTHFSAEKRTTVPGARSIYEGLGAMFG